MKIDKTKAEDLLRDEASKTRIGPIDPQWIEKVEKLSRLCEEGVSKTHIAFLGTAMLAKAIDQRADLYAIKPQHARDNPHAFSARTLCHSVLVPLSAELGINIGVTGREPLNNQPYFRMTRLGDDTPVHKGGRAAFDYMLKLVKELQNVVHEDQAREALRAYVAVRRKYKPRYTTNRDAIAITPERLPRVTRDFVRENSEGGRRAQAIVAGLFDVFAGVDRVESGRINDPSRKYPGDVCVRGDRAPDVWEKAIEVRDKPVSAADVQIFGKKCVDMGVREAAVVMVSDAQEILDEKPLSSWASEFGLGLTLFHGWETFIDQALFWSGLAKPEAAIQAASLIGDRLISVEASIKAVKLWQELVCRNQS